MTSTEKYARNVKTNQEELERRPQALWLSLGVVTWAAWTAEQAAAVAGEDDDDFDDGT